MQTQQIRILTSEYEKEIQRLNLDCQSLKNSVKGADNNSDMSKEYRDKCMRLEKYLIEMEQAIAMKDLEICKIENELGKIKTKYQNLERRMELGTKNDFPKSDFPKTLSKLGKIS